jgi:membrane protein implicated in regulation of membrane protease activity
VLTLYVVCLLLGGLLIALSIFGGGDTDVDVDVAADVDIDVDVDGGDVDVDVDGDGGEGLAAAARFLSMRNLVFFLAFFGLTGTLLTLLQANHAATLLTSGGLGILAAWAVHRLMGYLRGSQSGALPSPSALAGSEARVVVGITPTRPGKVDVIAGDRTYQYLARIHAGAELDRVEAGDTVIVVRIQDGTALVADKSYLV